MSQRFITENEFWRMRELSKMYATYLAENREAHPDLGTPLTGDAVLKELDGFWTRHQDVLIGAGIDYIFDLVQVAVYPDVEPAQYQEHLKSLSVEDIVLIMEGEVGDMKMRIDTVYAQRAKLVEDIKVTLADLTRRAIALAITAAI